LKWHFFKSLKTFNMKKNLLCFSLFLLTGLSVYFISCSKSSPTPDPTPTPLTCAQKAIVVTATPTATSGGTTTNGSIAASATGSTGFTYSLGTGAFQASGTFSNLAAGTYTITAKDDAGCTATKSATVTAGACPTITLTAAITQASNATAANGAINATATGSTGITYSLGTGAFQASGNFTGLTVNSYQVTAKDVNGCTVSSTFNVTAVSCPTITVTNTITATAGPTATNGSISATATGGTAPYTYALGAGAFQSSGVFGSLSAGNYTITAKDANGCTSAATAAVVTSAACPTITISNTIVGAELCPTTNVGAITVNATGSTNLMYRLNSGGVTGTYQTSNMFTALATGSFTIDVRDGNGCVASSSASVPVAAAGPKFLAVKGVLATSCATAGCHNATTQQSGYNFLDECTIVAAKVRINVRAVQLGTMPAAGALPATEKQKITDWINAGGLRSN
jgi:GH24 family phage-related lysozyme (muramidase)